MARQQRIVFTWQRRLAGRHTSRLRTAALAALERLGVRAGEVGVLISDDATIRDLNWRFRYKDRATDVLSFPGEPAPDSSDPYLGDIAISLDTAARQARKAGHGVDRELGILLLHGVLHLCGYDHTRDGGEMAALEGRLRAEILP